MGRRSTGTVEPLKTSIRLKFTFRGARCVETLDLVPTPANLKAAARLMERIVGAIQAGVYRREDYFDSPTRLAARQTFSEFAEEWLKTLVVEKSTLESYKVALSASWKPAFGDEPLAQIKPSDLKKAIAARAAVVSGKTINNHLIVARAVFRAALEDGLITSDPSAKLENLAHQAPPPDPLDAEEMAAVLAHIRLKHHEQVWNYFTLAFHTGLRPSEQIALAWPDIDWKRGKAKVSRAIVVGEEKGTKTNRAREVDLSDAAIEALKRQKAHTFMKRPDGPVFENPETGKPWPDLQVQRRRYWTPTLKALGLRHRDAYQTRHTFATLLLMGGVNPTYISRQLGHANTGMLFKVYGTWIEGADRGAEAAKANALLGAKPAQSSTNCPRTEGAP